jgi:hypothetical protein
MSLMTMEHRISRGPRISRAASTVSIVAIAVSGCVTKSSNPLSPTVAGPLPGVNITAPKPVQPTTGTRIAVDKQPVTLVVANATTNGVRPLSYLFEVATDTGFSNKVFSRAGVAPGDSQTTLRLPDALATGRSYFWHARAQDGANTGSFSEAATFDIYTPVVIQAPVPVAPINNTVVTTTRPRFTFTNAPRSGPVGAINYAIQLADNSALANPIALWTVAEQSTQTSLDAPVDIPTNKQWFWQVRAFDPTTTGPWSAVQVFQTAAAAPPPSGGGGGTGPAPNDQMNLSLAAVYNSPADVASWPATAAVTSLTFAHGTGVTIHFTKENSWPVYTPPGWAGGLTYTVWAVVKVNGRWNTSGFIEMWPGRAGTGAGIVSPASCGATDFACNWAYDSRWGPMAHYNPSAGEQMGFFVSAGDARGVGTVTSVRERSNVVVVALPPADSGSFTFSVLSMPLSLLHH